MRLSIILPTYNNEITIEECLRSLREQNFSNKDYEILLIDGGSDDKTLEIAKKYKVNIVKNPHRIEEQARIIGIKIARGEILAFIDADNVLLDKNWFKKMLEPFADKEIAFADTLYYDYRKYDKIKVRYQALIGGDDPFAAYLGLYSRWCYFKNDWTDFPYQKEVKDKYWRCKFKNLNLVPAMGSNGFLIRASVLKKFIKNSFIHSDIIYELVNNGYNCFAKVDTGIVHNQPTFFNNKVRRIKRRIKGDVKIKYNYGITKWKTIKMLIWIILVFPIIADMIAGYIKKRDSAWIFHPVACYGELGIHVYYNTIGRMFID